MFSCKILQRCCGIKSARCHQNNRFNNDRATRCTQGGAAIISEVVLNKKHVLLISRFIPILHSFCIVPVSLWSTGRAVWVLTEGMAEKNKEKKWRRPAVTALKRIHWACSPLLSILKRPSAMINSQQERERGWRHQNTHIEIIHKAEEHRWCWMSRVAKNEGKKQIAGRLWSNLAVKMQLSSLFPHSLRANEPKRGGFKHTVQPPPTPAIYIIYALLQQPLSPAGACGCRTWTCCYSKITPPFLFQLA